MLFEVAIILEPTITEKENGAIEKILVAPVSIIANSEQAAGAKALKMNMENIDKDLFDRAEVLVRPFMQR